MAQAWTDDADEIPPAVTVVHAQAPTQDPDASDATDGSETSDYEVVVGDDGRRRLTGLAGRFS